MCHTKVFNSVAKEKDKIARLTDFNTRLMPGNRRDVLTVSFSFIPRRYIPDWDDTVGARYEMPVRV